MPIGIPLTLAGFGALVMLVAVPLIKRRVPPNQLYGLRVPATFADESVWYEANAASGRDLLVLGALLFALAFLLLPLRLPPERYGMIWAVVAVVGALATAVVGTFRANRLLSARGKSGEASASR